ncbi:MAG: hypothetical protein AAF721_31875 [Myxococcota bacterium]
MTQRIALASSLSVAAALVATTVFAAPSPRAAKVSKTRVNRTVKKAPRRATTANQKLFLKKATVDRLWTSLSKRFAVVHGTIQVDAAVQPYVTGSCSDVVIKGYGGSNFGDEIVSMRATGSIASGSCSYSMFVKPQGELRVLSFYEGTRNPGHPGDYLEINGQGPHTFAASAGSRYERNFTLTYDWIK